MDLTARLQQLEVLVSEAKSMPLSSSALLNREELLELIAEMKDSLPEEIKQARWVVKDREELLAKARAEAESIVAKAREEQMNLAQQEKVLERAKEEAARILELADDESRRVRLEAEDYVDAKLAQFENVLRKVGDDVGSTIGALQRTLDQVELGRDKLRGTATVAEQELAPEPEDQPEEELAPELPGPDEAEGGR
jgi:vacuolar-type H+-ATPase subunit H